MGGDGSSPLEFKGESYEVPDVPGLRMDVGNAGGLEVLVNRTPIGSLGPSGKVRRDILLQPAALNQAVLDVN